MTLPPQFSNVDLTDLAFSTALNDILNGSDNLFIEGAAGVGKSLMIKILATTTKSCVVLSTTGITALNLCTDEIKASTIHSFFLLPPVDIIPDDTTISGKIIQNINAAKTIVIDEASMMSSQLFDAIVKKTSRLRRKGSLPRFILFGDVMQLPPVISGDQNVRDFYAKEYNGNVMFFNSKWYQMLGFRTHTLRKIYRQQDPEYKQRLIEIGFNEHTQATYDYFNARKMPLAQFEAAHPQYVRLAPTNAIVNKVNAEYVVNFPGQEQRYHAQNHGWKGQTPNDETVILKPGIQVMCLTNRYDSEQGLDYRNGALGVVTSLGPDFCIIQKADGTSTPVARSTQFQYVATVDPVTGDVIYEARGSFTQLDCKPCKACTIHKAQGKSIDSVYLQLNQWCPEGLLYVALSRTPTIGGLGLSREITAKDVNVNREAWEFLQIGNLPSITVPDPEPDWDAVVGAP